MDRPRRIVLAVFIDGFGWALSQRIPFLQDVLSHRRPLRTEFGYSSTCDPTILTGAAPRDHGHFSFFVHDPARSPFGWLRPLGLLPSALADRARVRNWISRGVGAALGWTGYFQLYNVPWDVLPLMDYSEKRDLYQPGGILGGQPTVFDDLRRRAIPFHLSDWRRGEDENFAALQAAVEEGRVALAWLFLGGLDGVLHLKGTAAPEVAARLRSYEDRLRRVLQAAGRRYDEVRLHAFSDHGMADVRSTVDVMGRVARSGLRFGRDYAAVYDSTMARFWFLREGARPALESALQGLAGGRWLADETLRDWGCDFPGRRYGHRFWLADPGVLIVPSHMGLRPIAGMHGYAPDDPDSVAFYGTNTPDEPGRARPGCLRDLKDTVLADVPGRDGP